jgi:periplasmic protein CpxP/Spy
MLIMRWQYLTLLTAVTILAAGSLSALVVTHSHNRDRLGVYEERDNSTAYSSIADNSAPVTQQNHQKNLLQQLNLTAEQQQQIKQIHAQYQEQIHRRKKNLALLEKRLAAMISGTDRVDLVRAKNQELVRLRQEIGELRFESMLATREILTPEQRQKFREIIESLQAK